VKSHLGRVVMGILLTGAALGCGGTKVMVPPRIDLQQHEVLAVIEFSSSREGELAPLATARFVEAIRADQGLVRIVDLGTETEALRAVGAAHLDRAAYQALGQTHDVNTIFTGELIISDIRPAIRITSDLANMGVAADVDATLNVEMVETASGASIWSRSASVTKRVGQVSLLGSRDVVFDADNPERAYGELIDALVVAVSGDFRARWERR
jgi:hypothetical protein